MKAKIDLDKFVLSLMKRYYEKIHIDPTTTKCWLDSVLEDQNLEYKDEKIIETPQESEDERVRKAIISYIDYEAQRGGEWFGVKVDDIIAWLEKASAKTKVD